MLINYECVQRLTSSVRCHKCNLHGKNMEKHNNKCPTSGKTNKKTNKKYESLQL